MAANPLVNTATATDVATGATASGSDSDALAPQVTLAVVKTDGSSTYTPGGSANYTLTITDAGLSDATNVTVADPLPSGVTLSANATCVANGRRAAERHRRHGQTSFGATGASIAAGARQLAGVHGAGRVRGRHDGRSARQHRDGHRSALGRERRKATDSDALARAGVARGDQDRRQHATYMPGGSATYTITVSNTGVSDALDVTVSRSRCRPG